MQATLLSLFEFGTLWFWILIIATSGLIIRSTEDDDDNAVSNVWFILALLALYFLGNSEFFKEVGWYV